MTSAQRPSDGGIEARTNIDKIMPFALDLCTRILKLIIQFEILGTSCSPVGK